MKPIISHPPLPFLVLIPYSVRPEPPRASCSKAADIYTPHTCNAQTQTVPTRRSSDATRCRHPRTDKKATKQREENNPGHNKEEVIQNKELAKPNHDKEEVIQREELSKPRHSGEDEVIQGDEQAKPSHSKKGGEVARDVVGKSRRSSQPPPVPPRTTAIITEESSTKAKCRTRRASSPLPAR
ncbi:hypothetical protein evm_013288 [Chilo suppressalis]|nr:hypothetical protein evm_013288 [Chilo suppressalis]